MSILADFLMPVTDLKLLGLVAVGTFAGIYVGAIPGLSVTMAVSILISFTFSWDVYPALALMIGIYMGGVYGGSRTAILLNIPGAPSAIATALDGFPLAQQGRAGEAIGIVTVVSFIGGFIGILALALFAPSLSDFAIRFQPRDFMLLAIMGILLVGSLSGESLIKGVFSGALGIAIGAFLLELGALRVCSRALFLEFSALRLSGCALRCKIIALFLLHFERIVWIGRTFSRFRLASGILRFLRLF